jgi:hypothetical protein
MTKKPTLSEQVKALTAEVEQLRSRGWQPIETAPKDGTVVDLYTATGYRFCDYRFDKDFYYPAWSEARSAHRGWRDRPFLHDRQITHWMPRVAPPEPT